MSRALRELGLGPDADERAVKRAYAAKLKTTRPEDDPEGFQRLNAAYQAALQQLSSDDAWQATTATGQRIENNAGDLQWHTGDPAQAMDVRTAHIHALLDPTVPEAIHDLTTDEGLPAFEFMGFYAELRERVSIDNAAELGHWLHSQHALYAVSLKDRVAEQLVFQLRRDPPLPLDHLRALLQFFSLDTISTLSWRLQDELHLLAEHASPSTAYGSGWSQLMLDPALRQKQFRKLSMGWRIWGVFLFAVLGIVFATWITDFIRYSLPGFSHNREMP